MKRVNTNSQIGKALASLALFERIQAMYHLHPGKIAEMIKDLGKQLKKDPAGLVEPLRIEARVVFDEALRSLQYSATQNPAWDTEPLKPGEFREYVEEFFRLGDSIEKPENYWFAKGMFTKTESEKLNKLEVAQYFFEEVPKVMEWAFDQTAKILNPPEQ